MRLGRLAFASALLLAALTTAVVSQGLVLPCYFVTSVQCQRVSAATPLPVAIISGGGGGGGGAVTVADGADVAEGAVADTAYAGSGNTTVIAALKGIYASVNSSIPAGTAIIGKIGIDQTTPGTTNAVAFTNTSIAVTNAGTFATQSAITAASGAFAAGSFASGAHATGSFASGAFASGSVASGAFASGALASGSVASGAMVDITAEQTPITPATATATKGFLLGGQYNSTQATFTNGQQGALQFSSRGEAKTNLMDAAGNARGANVDANNNLGVVLPAETTKVIGTVNGAQGSTALSATNGGFQNILQGNAVLSATNPVFNAAVPTTAGGLSVYFVQPTASDNHVVIKAGAGQVYKVSVTNNSATVNYLRLYNATTGFNGCNSATNLVYQVAIPASTSVGGISDSWDTGIAFSTGISICVTSAYATTDTTNATASAMSVNIGYK